MPIPLQHALEEQATAARTKVSLLRSPGRYLLLSALAGAFIGVAGVLLIMVTGPLGAQHSAWTKLIQGGVFGIALILVVFAGSELCTGNVLTMTQGVTRRRVSPLGAVGVIVFSFIGNLIGSIVFAWIVHSAGVLDMVGVPGKPAPGATLLTGMLTTKIHESTEALFFRGVLCNFLVCLALWTAGRTRSDGAKIALIFWCLLAFIGSGFEHVVANMTYFSLGLFQHVPGVTVGAFARDLLFVGLGNLVGGAVLVGIAYSVIARPAKGAGTQTDTQTDTQTGAPVTPPVGAQTGVPVETARS